MKEYVRYTIVKKIFVSYLGLVILCFVTINFNVAYAVNADELIGTEWTCTSDNIEVGVDYPSDQLIFKPNGHLLMSRSIGIWQLRGSKITFSVNNGYANYAGKFANNKFFYGTAKNKPGKKWNFECKLTK